jgi:hypothetical protein
MKILKCYIAGALNSDACGYIRNLHKMIGYAEQVRLLGLSVYVPGLDFLLGLVHGNYQYEDYFNNSSPWLLSSDCVFLVPGWEMSIGTFKEIEMARESGIPTFSSIDELKAWVTSKYENEG